MTIALWQRPLARVVQGIVKAGNGCWLDPSDMSTMFQDAAGTIPVTAVEQPVGKIIDKSGNGYHATQSVTASRPTLSARYNLLTKTEDLSDAVWNKDYCTITTNSTTDPFGGNSADTITSTSSYLNTFIYQFVAPLASGAIYTASRYVKAGSITKCTLGLHQLADIYFDLNTLSYNIIGDGAISASIIDVGGGWRKITGSWQWGSGTVSRVYFAAASTMSSQIGVPVGGTLYSFGHSFVLGTTSGPYQRVNTSTDYDTDERYFPKYLRFDGVDDYLNLPYMGLYANGSASVIMARNELLSAATGRILCEASTTTSALYALRVNSINQFGAAIINDAATILLNQSFANDNSSKANVISSIDTGNSIRQYRNSGLFGSTGYTRSSALTPVNTTIGAKVAATVTEYAAMNLYGLIITKSALTDAQRVRCERFLARKAGVML